MAETVELHHEYGITPSDLQGYFQQMIQQKHDSSINTNQYRSNGELISPTAITTTCKSSTETETYYYTDKKAEHHILMPALDEKDSLEPSTLMDDTPKQTMEDKMNIIKMKSPTVGDIDCDHDGDIDDDESENDIPPPAPMMSEDDLELQYDDCLTADVESAGQSTTQSVKPPSIQITEHLMSEPTEVNTRHAVGKGHYASDDILHLNNLKLESIEQSIFSSTTPYDYRTSDNDVCSQ